MGVSISPVIKWVDQTDSFRSWLACHPNISPCFLHASREADIWSLTSDAVPAYVLKRWKPGRWVDGRDSFYLLQDLALLQLPVPSPGGWGHDTQGLQVLAMEYAGEPVDRASRRDVLAFGHALATIHRTPIDRLSFDAPADSSIFLQRLRTRFFDGVEVYPDLTTLLDWIWPRVPPLQTVLLHGDYHLGNVAWGNDSLSIIDWSEAQLGDWRYDVAWAELLTLIYTGPEACEIFMAAYETASDRILGADLEPYEVVATLRWLLLCRTAPFPVPDGWRHVAEAFLRKRLPASTREMLHTRDG